MIRSLQKSFTFLKGFILFNIIWYLGALSLNSRVLPKPLAVYKNLGKILSGNFHIHLLASLYRVGLGLFISVGIGMVIGLLMGYSKNINKLLNPLIYFTYPIPKTALLPIVMILFGLGDNSKITIIVLITVFQVILSVRDSVSNIPKEVYIPLQSLGAKPHHIFIHITIPAILPELLTNMRLSVGTALSILFFAEAYGTNKGVGYYIQDAWTRIDYLSMYGGILILGLLGFILFISIDMIEESLCKWKH